MAVQWNIVSNTHGRMVTCQKPIVITMRTNNIQVSHFKIDLQIRALEETLDDGGWISTELNVCAYPDGPPDNNNYTYYTVNFAEYCSNYFNLSSQVLMDSYCPNNSIINPFILTNPGVVSTTNFNYMFQREFRAKIHPITITGDGAYDEETDNYDFCKEFMCVNLNTNDNETTSANSVFDNIRINDFVNGFVTSNSNNANNYGQGSYGSDKRQKLLTNMPGVAAVGQEPEEPVQTINLKDKKVHWVGYGWNFNDFSAGGHVRKHYFQIRSLSGTINTVSISSSDTPPWTQTNPTDIGWLYINPIQLQFALDSYGVGADLILDGSSNLMCNRIKAWVEFIDSSGTVQRTSPSFTYNVINSVNDKKCKRVRFIFINKRGHLDWFHCYGTQEKSVSVEGVTYERLSELYKGVNAKNASAPGLSNLQNKRTDTYKIISQPLTKRWTEWLQELITSPMVWVEDFVEGMEVMTNTGQQLVTQDNAEELGTFIWPSKLNPIIIDKASYNVYNTEDNVHYMEFKYIKANQMTIQKGY